MLLRQKDSNRNWHKLITAFFPGLHLDTCPSQQVFTLGMYRVGTPLLRPKGETEGGATGVKGNQKKMNPQSKGRKTTVILKRLKELRKKHSSFPPVPPTSLTETWGTLFLLHNLPSTLTFFPKLSHRKYLGNAYPVQESEEFSKATHKLFTYFLHFFVMRSFSPTVVGSEPVGRKSSVSFHREAQI